MAAIKLIRNENAKYFIEITLDAEFSDFVFYGSLMEKKLNVNFSDKVDDFDTHFWTFTFREVEYIYYYNIYSGIRIYLSDQQSSEDEMKVVNLMNELPEYQISL